MKTTRILPLTVCLVSFFGAVGCNYSARNALPEHLKTVAVPVFRNSTHLNEYSRGVEVELTHAVRKALLQAGELRLSGREDGDLIVEGDVRELERNVIRADRYGDPAEIRLTVRAKISAYDVKKNRWLIRDRIVTNGDLRPESGVYNLRRGETESWARQQALEDLGRRIARAVVEIW
jgi:hypothetical protein